MVEEAQQDSPINVDEEVVDNKLYDYLYIQILKEGPDGKPFVDRRFLQNSDEYLFNASKEGSKRAKEGALYFINGFLHKTVLVYTEKDNPDSSYLTEAEQYYLVIKNRRGGASFVVKNDDPILFTSDLNAKERLLEPTEYFKSFKLRFPFEDSTLDESTHLYCVLYQSKVKFLCEQYAKS